MFDKFGNLSFLRHETQAFDQAPMVNSYDDEDKKLLKNIKSVAPSTVPRDANIICSRVI